MSDRENIEQTIQTYFESMYESDEGKAKAAFHPDARIVGYLTGSLANMSVEEFAGFVSGQPSAKAAGLPARLEIVSCEIAGQTAVARVRDDYLGLTFLDTLSLLEENGQWRIVGKLFHVEGNAEN